MKEINRILCKACDEDGHNCPFPPSPLYPFFPYLTNFTPPIIYIHTLQYGKLVILTPFSKNSVFIYFTHHFNWSHEFKMRYKIIKELQTYI